MVSFILRYWGKVEYKNLRIFLFQAASSAIVHKGKLHIQNHRYGSMFLETYHDI